MTEDYGEHGKELAAIPEAALGSRTGGRECPLC